MLATQSRLLHQSNHRFAAGPIGESSDEEGEEAGASGAGGGEAMEEELPDDSIHTFEGHTSRWGLCVGVGATVGLEGRLAHERPCVRRLPGNAAAPAGRAVAQGAPLLSIHCYSMMSIAGGCSRKPAARAGANGAARLCPAPAGGVYAVAWSPTQPDLVATGGGDDRGFMWRVG